MSTTLAMALCNNGLTTGFAEVRRLIDGKAITINGEFAISWDQLVYIGDILKVGKHKTCVVK